VSDTRSSTPGRRPSESGRTSSGDMPGVRAMVVLYLLIIAVGLSVYIVIGLTHH
jgi:hypothetical protein